MRRARFLAEARARKICTGMGLLCSLCAGASCSSGEDSDRRICTREDSVEGSVGSGGVSGEDQFLHETAKCSCGDLLLPGKAGGEPCQSPGECAQLCCECPTGPGRFLVQRCSQSVCVGAPDACSIALQTSDTVQSFCASG
jgi:hypothetical protein